ncbi:MAG: Uma2 family endonuclease [Minicystis sp.]
MSSTPGKKPLREGSPLAVPALDEWRAMSPDERDRLVLRIMDALSDPQRALPEGRRHKKAKGQVVDVLGLHFGSTGRVIYLAEEMTVMYPGEDAFTPDVLAVLDVPQPDDDPRMAWVVADEGRGLDLVIEVLHQGNRKKDLVENVERYARLGIPEYFIYDRLHQQIHGYRLPAPGPGRYQRIVPQFGRYSSAVLGLDLAVQGGQLRFFYGMAELFGSADLIGRLHGMVEELSTKADEQQARIEQMLTGMREAVVAAIAARGIAMSDEARERLASCDEVAKLQGWLLRALSATSLDDVFAP